jgi:hypothetical protein
MQFRIIEDVARDVNTVEQNSTLQIEFQIYSHDKSNPTADQYIAQLEQRLSAFGAENSEVTNEEGWPYSMFRLTSNTFNSKAEMANFFQRQFPEFPKLLNQIWRSSKNFVRVVVVEDSNPPKRIPGDTYTLLSTADYQDMLMGLKGA